MRYFLLKNTQKQFIFYQRFILFLSTLLLCLLGSLIQLPAQSHLNVASAAIAIQLPLSTLGAKIVDARGKQVLLRGVNWFGMETETHVPHGLWQRDYKEMLSQMKMLGYNLIRLPYSVAGLRAPDINGVEFNIGSNIEFQGKTPLEVMDLIVQEAERQGLFILLDSHRLNDQRIPELWYGDGFTEADWIDTWKLLAERYKNQTNVIGADLKNEPHGRASWGTNDLATDWRLAAERAGNAILSINPNWLIIVEGVENNVPGQKLKHHWQGGNLEGVKRYPVRLTNRRKLVYSPHEYGSGVFNQPYFSESSFPKNLIPRWQIGFNYISTQNIAPILIGEFGGRQVDNISPEGIWQNEFVKYIQKHNLSFAYWSWNPNSADTGGILLDDWQNYDRAKQQLLSQLLPSMAVNNQNVASSPNPPIPATPTTTAKLKVTTNIYANWETGLCANLKILNSSNSKANNWQLTFRMNQARINNSWNANFQQQGTEYIVTPLDWARVIEPNQSRDFGFCAQKLGTDYQLQNIEVKITQ
ncbi:cellulase family glycosylhydrolase [Calothrix anomala]|uniref:Endoglucanase n=2 Tax=Calothrix TaxID=1186 RepID=A0ABR8AK83_9CYAN|nr:MULTISPECIES: cellulase family glycosylhydrolase [Calothrix]MBD2200432.1 cellulase family glycosylhydrolase [Calothrix parietina FACHB-288]MBD2227302.1 cellulase family glycosylhydrolase [Calothrix anomala FACHB-343]